MSEDKVVDILKQARNLLVEKGWTQGCLARDLKGGEVDYLSDNAASFCMMGAITRATWDLDEPDSQQFNFGIDAQRALRVEVGDRPLPLWNDSPGRKVDAVLHAFDEVIAKRTSGKR